MNDAQEIIWRNAGVCYQPNGHTGPCNGLPRLDCLQRDEIRSIIQQRPRDEEKPRCRDPWHEAPVGLRRTSCPTCGPTGRIANWPKAALRQRTSEERKGEPVYTGCMMYFPDALAAISRLSKAGNDKHNPGEPLHWARDKSTDQMDCAARHMLTPAEVDPVNRESDLVAAVWRLLAELQLAEEKRLAAAGIMPYSGIVP